MDWIVHNRLYTTPSVPMKLLPFYGVTNGGKKWVRWRDNKLLDELKRKGVKLLPEKDRMQSRWDKLKQKGGTYLCF